MAFKFESLRIWQESMELGEEINALTDKFPKKEIYNLSSQIRRPADIAEHSRKIVRAH
jgi:four helix bundle protein